MQFKKFGWVNGFNLTALCILLAKVKKVLKANGFFIPFKNGTLVIAWVHGEVRKK